MPIEFRCPHCFNTISAPDEAAGKTGRCRFCNAAIQAPSGPDGAPKLIEPGKPMPGSAPPGSQATTGEEPGAPPYGTPPGGGASAPGYNVPPPGASPYGYAPAYAGGGPQPGSIIDPGAIVGEAWQVATSNMGILMGAMVIVGVIFYAFMFFVLLMMMPNLFTPSAAPPSPSVMFVPQIASLVFYPLFFGLFAMADELLTSGSTSLATLLVPYRRFWRFAGTLILVGLIMMVFYLPMYIPVLRALESNESIPGWMTLADIVLSVVLTYISLGLIWAPLEVIDRNASPLDAIQASWQAASGKRLRLFGTTLLLGLLYMAGALFCGIGVLFTAPIAIVGTMIAYRQLRGLRADF